MNIKEDDMKKEHIDFSFLKDMDEGTDHYEIMDIFSNRQGLPLTVCISRQANPARYCIIGNMFSAYFLSYTDLENFLKAGRMHKWTKEDEKRFENKYHRSTGVFKSLY